MKPELTSCATGTAILTFEQGDQLVISSTLGLPGWDWCWQAGSYGDFVGPKGVVKEALLSSGGRGFITIATGKDQEEQVEFPKQPPLEDFDSELRHFMECLREGREPRATGEDGVAATRAVEAIIDAVHGSGTKIVMTTHDLGQARRLADDVLFLHRGRLLERAPAADFFAGPNNDLAQAFVAGELLWWKRGEKSRKHEQSTDSFKPRGDGQR